MQTTRFRKIQTVLLAMKRAETARLKAKLAEVVSTRSKARELRENSASQPTVTTASEMQHQSLRQQADEAAARVLDEHALVLEREARVMQEALALTLGREQAAAALANSAAKAHRALIERRSEAVPASRKPYLSSGSGTSSVGTE